MVLCAEILSLIFLFLHSRTMQMTGVLFVVPEILANNIITVYPYRESVPVVGPQRAEVSWIYFFLNSSFQTPSAF